MVSYLRRRYEAQSSGLSACPLGDGSSGSSFDENCGGRYSRRGLSGKGRMSGRPRVFIRFVVKRLDSDSGRREGLFQAAVRLRESDDITGQDRKLLVALFNWFNQNLKRPAGLSTVSASACQGASDQLVQGHLDSARQPDAAVPADSGEIRHRGRNAPNAPDLVTSSTRTGSKSRLIHSATREPRCGSQPALSGRAAAMDARINRRWRGPCA